MFLSEEGTPGVASIKCCLKHAVLNEAIGGKNILMRYENEQRVFSIAID
jgi:hypothetical protein